jgi:hypothetical protein
VLLYFSLKRIFLSIGNYAGATLPATLEDSHHGGFILGSSAGNTLGRFPLVRIPSFAADKSLVRFTFPTQQVFERSAVQCQPNPMLEEPWISE